MPLRAQLRENGVYLTAVRAAGSVARRLRDRLLARRLRTTGLRLGRTPHLAGLAHMRLGANFAAGNYLWLEAVKEFAGQRFTPELTIGPGCNFSDSVHVGCAYRVTIGAGVLLGSKVLITDHAHGIYTGDGQSSPATRPVDRRLAVGREIVIGDNVWLGDGVCVLPGAVIGAGAVVGANSVVTGTIPPATIAVGAPARVIRHWDEAAQAWLPEDGVPAASSILVPDE